MDISESQEKIFKIFDNLIEDGVCVSAESRANESLRKRINRNFNNVGGRSKVDSALYLYGFDDFSGTPTPLEIQRSIYVSDKYTVEIHEDKFNELLAVYNVTEDDLRRLFRPFLQDLRLDSLGLFISEVEEDEFSYNLLRDFNELRGTSLTYFADMNELRTLYNVDVKIRNYARDYSRARLFISLGNEFESLLRRFDFLGESGSYKYNPRIGNCQPDFLIGDTWIDAKLSKSTALNYGDDTIRKYSEHTDDLIIVYALDDGADVSDVEREYGVTFKHVSEYFENVNEEAIEEINEFIKKASSIRGVQL